MRRLLACLSLLLAGCAGQALVPGQSTLADVEAKWGQPADKRVHGDEVVYYYPQLPWGYSTYAARVGPDGKLVAFEQRLTEDNIGKVVKGKTTGAEVRDLLGPSYQPMKVARMEREILTYPMRIAGFPTPKWFLVQVGPDDVVRETYLIDDPEYNRWGGSRRR
jgi:hypothetical protein